MRITNRIITNNSLSNINRVKTTQDKLNVMMATGKKITKPSDDPVVAIRALRLRSGSSKIDQYYEKNTKDAEAWMKVTDTTLHTVSEVLEDMLEQVGKGTSDTMATSERKTITEYLASLAKEIYDNGDADYADRYIFTGYRTDVPLTFDRATDLKYTITEQLDKSAVDTVQHVFMDDLMSFTTENYDSLTASEQNIEVSDVHRIQLAYSAIDSGVAPQISYYDETGALNTVTANITMLGTGADPYVNVADDAVNFIPETGELIIGKDLYTKLMNTKDNPATTDIDEGELRIEYEKSSWADGDLRPEHYFYCKTTDAEGREIVYNEEYLVGAGRQIIEYDTGANQSIQINTLADECFTHDIGRLVYDLNNATEELATIDDIVLKLEKIVATEGLAAADVVVAEDKLNAAKKAQALQRDKVQKMFDASKTAVQGFMERTSLASTNCGSRESRLALIQNRLSDQQTTMDNLVSENEDCDETEVAIELAGAKLSYEAALMATSKITQTTLLDYI